MMKYLFFFLTLFLLNHGVLSALTLEQAAGEVSAYFFKTDVQHENTTQIYIQVVNAYSGDNDSTSQEIETGLQQAFENQFSEVEVSVGPAKKDTIQINANYRQKGITTLLQVTAINTGSKNIILGSKLVRFVFGEEREDKLAAILDLTSAELTIDQKEDFGDDFRSELGKKDLFDNIEILDIDDYDIPAIAKKSHCADMVILDKCARNIGVELKVDWIISSNYLKVSAEKYMLSAKILDIVNGTSLATEVLEHDGNPDTLGTELENLAEKLASSVDTDPAPKKLRKPYIPKMITGRSRMPSRAELLAESASGDGERRAETNWHIWALTTIGVATTLSFISAMEYNDQMREAREAIEYGDYEQYDKNVRQAQDARERYQFFDAVTIAALIWETYLLVFSDINLNGTLASFEVRPEIKPLKESNLAAISLSFQWHW